MRSNRGEGAEEGGEGAEERGVGIEVETTTGAPEDRVEGDGVLLAAQATVINTLQLIKRKSIIL